ncbi:hypothetical protein BGZ97_002366, partial [Linnemannia gamsii]
DHACQAIIPKLNTLLRLSCRAWSFFAGTHVLEDLNIFQRGIGYIPVHRLKAELEFFPHF